MDVREAPSYRRTGRRIVLLGVLRNVRYILELARGFRILTPNHSWIYSSTVAYIVDANPGRASSAIAANSSFRGISGLIAAEVSVPLQVRPLLYPIGPLFMLPRNRTPWEMGVFIRSGRDY